MLQDTTLRRFLLEREVRLWIGKRSVGHCNGELKNWKRKSASITSESKEGIGMKMKKRELFVFAGQSNMMGAGVYTLKGVDRGVVREMIVAWLLTFPFCSLLGFIFGFILK